MVDERGRVVTGGVEDGSWVDIGSAELSNCTGSVVIGADPGKKAD